MIQHKLMLKKMKDRKIQNPNENTEWNDVLRSLPPKKEAAIDEDTMVQVLLTELS